jgi:hypothetical protein
MKANFDYNYDTALALCLQYSDEPETLKALLTSGKINITVARGPVIPSPWNDTRRKLNCVLYHVTVNGYGFPFYGSHADAETLTSRGNHQDSKELSKKRRKINDAFLYSILCCMKLDSQLYGYEPEDFGYSSDSIKDMAKWNEAKAHAHKLCAALGLTNDEVNSLPQ